jgi:hypothetical protein
VKKAILGHSRKNGGQSFAAEQIIMYFQQVDPKADTRLRGYDELFHQH